MGFPGFSEGYSEGYSEGFSGGFPDGFPKGFPAGLSSEFSGDSPGRFPIKFPISCPRPPKTAAGERPLLVGRSPSVRTTALSETKHSTQAPYSWGLGA